MKKEKEWIEWTPPKSIKYFFGKKNNKDYYIQYKNSGKIIHLLETNKEWEITNLEYVKKTGVTHKNYTTKEIMRKHPEMI